MARLLRKLKKTLRRVLERMRTKLDHTYLMHVGIERALTRLHGPVPPALGPNDVLLICIVRDGEYWADELIRHHQRLGVRHCVFFDNGSQDRTLERLAAHEHVTVYSLPLAFMRIERLACAWAMRRFARERWALVVDIDELFDYPGSDRMPLAELTRMLRETGATALPAVLLDMFDAEPVRWDDARPFDRARFDRYDGREIEATPFPNGFDIEQPRVPITSWRGGIRRSVFGTRPCLTKCPLVLGNARTDVTRSPHFPAHVRLSDTTGVLLHYKLVPNFAAAVRRAVAERNHWHGSLEYRHYAARIGSSATLDVMSASARQLLHTDQLIDDGLVQVGAAWRARLERGPRDRTS